MNLCCDSLELVWRQSHAASRWNVRFPFQQLLVLILEFCFPSVFMSQPTACYNAIVATSRPGFVLSVCHSLPMSSASLCLLASLAVSLNWGRRKQSGGWKLFASVTQFKNWKHKWHYLKKTKHVLPSSRLGFSGSISKESLRSNSWNFCSLVKRTCWSVSL